MKNATIRGEGGSIAERSGTVARQEPEVMRHGRMVAVMPVASPEKHYQVECSLAAITA